MLLRRLPLILPLLALPTLMACGNDGQASLPPPPSEVSVKAITSDPGVDRTALAHAIDGLFDEDTVGETRALVVMRGGLIVAERYGEGYGPQTRLLGWSASSCLTGLIIGQLVADGRLRRDESAPVPAWRRSGDPRGEITLRQLLQMRSGLRHKETSDPVHLSDTTRMLFLDGRDNMARFAEAQPLESEPGKAFNYSSATEVILSDLATRAVTTSSSPEVRRTAMGTYLRTRLLDPAGMTSFTPEFDAAGTMIGSTMMSANARDWAKLGEFLRNGGSVKGAQIVPRRWIDFMLSAPPQSPGYGAQVWLNRPQKDGSIALFPGRAPESAFGCVGQLGQYVFGSREQKLTVVRLGHTTEERAEALRQRLGDLIALFPGRQK